MRNLWGCKNYQSAIPNVTDGGRVVLKLVNGTVTARYLYGLGLVHATIGADSYYYSYNGHGDVVQLTDASGNVVRSYEYDAFGNELNPTAGDNNPFRYCGEYFDVETGSYYLRARYYNPSSGRFLTEDRHWNTGNMFYGDAPIQTGGKAYIPNIAAIRQSSNLYVYCTSNPVKYVDPTGMAEVLKFEDDRVTPIGGGSESLWLLELGLVIIDALLGTELVNKVVEKTRTGEADATKTKDWVKTQVAERPLDKSDLRDTTVYVIVEKVYQEVFYVGITKNFTKRKYAHQSGTKPNYPKDKFEMIPVATGLTRNEARVLEQTLIDAYTFDALDNARNSIALGNWEKYYYEIARVNYLLSGKGINYMWF